MCAGPGIQWPINRWLDKQNGRAWFRRIGDNFVFASRNGAWHARPRDTREALVATRSAARTEGDEQLPIKTTVDDSARYTTQVPVYDVHAAAGGWGRQARPGRSDGSKYGDNDWRRECSRHRFRAGPGSPRFAMVNGAYSGPALPDHGRVDCCWCRSTRISILKTADATPSNATIPPGSAMRMAGSTRRLNCNRSTRSIPRSTFPRRKPATSGSLGSLWA